MYIFVVYEIKAERNLSLRQQRSGENKSKYNIEFSYLFKIMLNNLEVLHNNHGENNVEMIKVYGV